MRYALMALFLFTAAPAFAQSGHHGHGAPANAPAGHDPVTAAFQAAAGKMHRDMDIPLTGDADVDFARGMIPHHQGAIDMARIQIAHGKDPAMRKLAEEIIAAQEREIAFLQSWLAKQAR